MLVSTTKHSMILNVWGSLTLFEVKSNYIYAGHDATSSFGAIFSIKLVSVNDKLLSRRSECYQSYQFGQTSLSLLLHSTVSDSERDDR